jgi:peptide chain release factor 2
MDTLISTLTDMKTQIDGLVARLDIAQKAARIEAIQQQAGANDFWDDPEYAQKLMQEMSALKAEVDRWQPVAQRIHDALELAELDDDSLLDDLTHELEALTPLVERMTFQAMLSGPYDAEDAIIAIHSGAGGTDSQDWAEILERMYIRWAERNGYKIEVLDRSEGEEAGIKSVTMMSIKGNYAFGYLQSEQGVHRLVRLSPFDAASRRHTSFAKVELWPDIQSDIDIEINENDLEHRHLSGRGRGRPARAEK